jgi:hypothetical protein
MGRLKASEVQSRLQALAGDQESFVYCDAGRLVGATVAEAASLALAEITAP